MKNFRKSPPAEWLPKLARTHAKSVNEHNSKALPATVLSISGRIVTVHFEVDCNPALPPFPMPIAESEYVRTPIQPGCKGVVLSADASLEQMSGLGTHRPALGVGTVNFGCCVFLPLTNAQWEKLDNNMLHLYGVAGTEILNRLNGASALRLIEDHASLTNGQATASMDGNAANITAGTINLNGTVVINGQPYKAHTHSNGHNGAPTGGVI